MTNCDCWMRVQNGHDSLCINQEMVSVDGVDYPKSHYQGVVADFNQNGEDVEVQFADGALWLYCADGRSIKLNAA